MRRGLTITIVAAALAVGAIPGASASTGWTIQPTPTPADGVDGQLLAVSCTSAASCTAVGYKSGWVTLAERYSGGTWRNQPTGSPSSPEELDGVSCSLASTCTAVGSYIRADNPLAEQN